jgi:tRNA threonylcarbamoyladenosine biosynthesis protein TsaE
VGNKVFATHSAEETIARGREIGARLKPPALILLSGELGAGKTTLTKGIVSGLGAAGEDEVTSPTFTLVHKYQHPREAEGAARRNAGRGTGGGAGDESAPVYHVDLYRVDDFRDLETLGLEDVLSEKAIVIVEWPEKLSLHTDWPILRVHLEHVSEDERRITIAGSAAD